MAVNRGTTGKDELPNGSIRRSTWKSRSLGKVMAVAVLPLAILPALSVPAESVPAESVPADTQPLMVACATSASPSKAPCPAGSPSIVAASAAAGLTVTSSGSVFDGTDGQMPGMNGQPLAAPIVGIDAAPDIKGYWLVASDGGVFSFGDARFYGSMGGTALNRPIVGISSTPTGQGYWLVASDGGIFSFGDAQFEGSMGGQPLNAPIVGMASTSHIQTDTEAAGTGYYLAAADGGVFTFGNAEFEGSMGRQPLNAPIVGIASTSYPSMHQETYQAASSGYYLAGADGGVFSFGYAPFYGSAVGSGDGTVIGIGASFIVDSPVLLHPLIAPVMYTSEGDILYWIN